jgi:hypothetical protein
MLIPSDPSSTIAASDFKNYLEAIDYQEPELQEHVRKEYHERLKKLKDKDGNPKYKSETDRNKVMHVVKGYIDSELGGNDRLGNRLDHPDNPPAAPPSPAEVRAEPNKRPGVDITPEGAIKHLDLATGLEMPEAHEYLHEIFDNILYTARTKLEYINVKLEMYIGAQNADNARAYEKAVADYEIYKASFLGVTPNPSPYASAFNQIRFKEVVTNEGFIVSLRVEINWKNPRHSSSTIQVS